MEKLDLLQKAKSFALQVHHEKGVAGLDAILEELDVELAKILVEFEDHKEMRDAFVKAKNEITATEVIENGKD